MASCILNTNLKQTSQRTKGKYAYINQRNELNVAVFSTQQRVETWELPVEAAGLLQPLPLKSLSQDKNDNEYSFTHPFMRII